MFNLFGPKPPLDEASIEWLFETFGWCLHHFDTDLFYQQSQLITPSNEHFPGRADSPEAMAKMIFSQIQNHALMAHWPLQMQEQSQCGVTATLQADYPWRGEDGGPVDGAIEVPFDAQQMAEPEALIASYAHLLTHHLGTEAAGGGIHQTEGLFTFGIAFLLLLVEAWLLSLLWPKSWRGGGGRRASR